MQYSGAFLRRKRYPIKAVIPYLVQPAKGFRYSTDAVFLAAFSAYTYAAFWADLGSGCGILAYRLANTWPLSHGIAIERDTDIFCYAKRNLNQLPVSLIKGDLRFFPWNENVLDLVVCNPPFFDPIASRPSPNLAKRIARHSFAGDMVSFGEAVYQALKIDGRLCFVFPVDLVQPKVGALEQAGFSIRRKLYLKSFLDLDPHRVCIEMVKTKTLPEINELTIFESPGNYTEEAWEFLMGPQNWLEFLKNKNRSEA